MVAYINQYENFDNNNNNKGFFSNKLNKNLESYISQKDNHNEYNNINKINFNEITYFINHQRNITLLSRTLVQLNLRNSYLMIMIK
jgi:hypothetical protein